MLDALRDLVAASTGLGTALVVGAPLRADGLLFNCAVVVCEGAVRGVVPKSYLPNYREFYEKRYFAAARDTDTRQIRLLGQDVAFGPGLLFDAEGLDDFSFYVEICEDLWVPVPPSTWAALAGATVLVNLSASNIVAGKAAYRRQLCQSQSTRCIAACPTPRRSAPGDHCRRVVTGVPPATPPPAPGSTNSRATSRAEPARVLMETSGS